MPQRYFFFSYSCRNNSRVSDGNLFVACDRFPPNEFLRGEAAKKSDFLKDDIVVTSIFEFNGKEDFESFNATDFIVA